MAQISDGDNNNNNILENDVAEETITTTTTNRHRSTHGDSLHARLPILPFELISEILSRVPVKFLIQFKCVSKSWKTLISDPQFAKKHLSAIHHHHYLLYCIYDPLCDFLLGSYSLQSIFESSPPISTQVSYPLNIDDDSFHFMVGSCDGMVCFAVDESCALLWNPTIREFKRLPPLEKYTIYGFGYDHSSDSYKVVAVLHHGCCNIDASTRVTEVKVHTLGTDSWRRIQEECRGIPIDSSAKFVSGTLNWLGSVDLFTLSYVIVSLDLGKESCEELLQPDYGEVTVHALSLGVLKNCLSILAHNKEGFSDVWLMNDYGNKESWTKLFCIPCLESSHYWRHSGRVICVSEDEELLYDFLAKLAVYDSRNGTFKFPEIPANNGWFVPQIYVESLISPCS